MLPLFALVLASYILGSIPFSYIAGKLGAGIDLREHGSGNLGASNAFRILGPRAAVLVLVGDAAKGFIPVRIAAVLAPASNVPVYYLMLACAFFAVLGHMFSVFLKFSGGKGIATSAGAFMALSPLVLLGALGVWGVFFAATRIVSLSSLAAAGALPVIVYLFGRWGLSDSHWSLLILSCLITVFVVIRHRSNIRRLLAGEEAVLWRSRK